MNALLEILLRSNFRYGRMPNFRAISVTGCVVMPLCSHA
jgi:hypothetical protein